MEMLKTNQKEQITVACYKSWKFQRSVIIHGEWGVLEGGGGGGGVRFEKLRQRIERRNSVVMTCHYPDLGSASDGLK